MAIDVAIYAGNLTTGQILTGLATAAGIYDIDPDPAAFNGNLANLLSGLRLCNRPLTAMIDALDESADPPHLAEQLLRPLIERGKGMIRLLMGTRWHVCDHFGLGWQARCKVIGLDSPDYSDPEALPQLYNTSWPPVIPRRDHRRVARRSPLGRLGF